jgi:hypothetical protein
VRHPVRAPVVLLVFNRPNTTRIVFERIREVRPSLLLVVADGPRSDCPEDARRCREVRKIVERIDWPCELLRNYSSINLGCKARIADGLNWVFRKVDRAIILEDDCLPKDSFFFFCEELLDRYLLGEEVLQISGTNFLFDRVRLSKSYYFSRYPLCWGWATWRRAWQHFDVEMKALRADRDKYLAIFPEPAEREFWREKWDRICSGKLNTWDYQWVFTHVRQNGLAVVPAMNLVTNIGFAHDATHTRSRLMALRAPTRQLVFPLIHPGRIERHPEADEYTASHLFRKRSVGGQAIEAISRHVLFWASHIRARLPLPA